MTPEQTKKWQEIKDHLAVKHKEELLYYLSPNMVLVQNLSVDDLDKLILLHEKLHSLFDEMRECKNMAVLPSYVKRVEEIEYEMQLAWKFPKDPSKHCWWYRVPHCKCPEIDNQENWGIPRRVINRECPVHGNLLTLSLQVPSNAGLSGGNPSAEADCSVIQSKGETTCRRES